MPLFSCILAVLISSLPATWPMMRLVHRFRDRFPVFPLAFVSQYSFALAIAWLVGVALDVSGVPMYAPPPKPGNFTLPIPWTYLLPSMQAVTFGPISGLLAGLWARKRFAKSK